MAGFKEFEGRFKFRPRFKWLVPLKIVSNVSRDMPALNLNRGLADLNRGSNSLNSISGDRNRIKNLETSFYHFLSVKF